MSEAFSDDILDEHPSLRFYKVPDPIEPSIEMQERVRLTPQIGIEVNVDAFPGNSHKRTPPPAALPEKEAEPEKRVEKVVEGKVVRRKPGIGKRMKAAFLEGDSKSVKEYILLEVLIPSIKDTIVDMAQGGIERLVLGDSARPRGRGRRGGGPAGNFNYNAVSQGPIQHPRGRPGSPQLSRRARAFHEIDEVVMDSRADADAVLTQMFDILDRYEFVKLSDFYELNGYTPDFPDHKYGWTDLRGTRPSRTRGGGWILDLPPVEPLD